MLHAGDVVRVDFGFPRRSVPGFERPAVVVTDDHVLEHGPRTLHVIPFTTTVGRSLATEVRLDHPGTGRPSAAQCHLLQVISVEQLVEESDHTASVGPVALAQVRSVLADLLGIG